MVRIRFQNPFYGAFQIATPIDWMELENIPAHNPFRSFIPNLPFPLKMPVAHTTFICNTRARNPGFYSMFCTPGLEETEWNAWELLILFLWLLHHTGLPLRHMDLGSRISISEKKGARSGVKPTCHFLNRSCSWEVGIGKKWGERKNKVTIYAKIIGKLLFSLITVMKTYFELYIAFRDG